jgi:pimeloyl-ACP methyl ester carboxylesterase
LPVIPWILLNRGGRRLHLVCECAGRGTILLEAGGSSSSLIWRNLQSCLAEFATVCAYFLATPAERAAGILGSLGAMPLTVVTHGRPFSGSEAFLEKGWIEAQQRLAAFSNQSKLIVAKDCGHRISLERPDFVVAILRKLVGELYA